MTKEPRLVCIHRCQILFLILFAFFVPCRAGLNPDSLKKSLMTFPADTASISKLINLSNKVTNTDEGAAELYARRAFDLASQLGDKLGLCKGTLNLGSKLLHSGNYTEASTHLINALRMAEELDNPDLCAKACNGLGNLFGYQDQGDAALPYYKRAWEYYKKSNNKPRIEIVLTNIGNIYYTKSASDKKYLDTAESYLKQSRTLLTELKDTVRLIANLDNLGLVYTDQGKNTSARELLLQSDALCKSTDDLYDRIFATSYLGRVYQNLNQTDSAIQCFNISLDLSVKMHNLMMIADAYLFLGESYSVKKQFEKAYAYSSKYLNLHDSLMNSDNTRKIAEAQSKFENEKKQRQIEVLELSSTHQHRMYTIITWSLIAGSVLLLTLALLMYNRYKLKNKAHKLLTHQNTIIAQKNKDITDSINYAKKIQDAMLPAVSDIGNAFLQSFVIYEPKDIVSGDFYWFTEKGENRFLAAVDCTGHGVPGAFMSMIGNDMLHDAIAERQLRVPGEVLTAMNRQVKNALKQGDADSESRDGMDMVLCVFDKAMQTCTYAGANRPLYVVRGGEVRIINPTKSSVGGAPATNKFLKAQN
ncbi:MAG TPA: tetratricopeptide repeat protein [Bacteroidia bacterium]|jgi:tetratricopeptide (TPR) repeat protein|nr:tetratricopeptide repeat protein [Bacteroidia bacterium]